MRKNPETSGDGTYSYHYQREERLQKNPRVKEAFYSEDSNCHSLPCFFKRNRGLGYLLVDVLILLLLFWGYTLFFNTSNDTLQKDGLKFSLYAFGTQEGVLVSLILRAERTPSTEGTYLDVEFEINGNRWKGRIRIPLQEGSEQVVRQGFPGIRGKEVRASFVWEGKSYTLSTLVERD
ncbi:MAG: hypothetical protein Kow009_12140 [Spirochaetales bacterium]